MITLHWLLGAGAQAAGAEGGSQSLLPTLVTFGLIFVVFYFLIIRPQSKRQKETRKMQDTLKKGDRVETIGGIQGTVQTVKEKSVVLRIADNVSVEFTRQAVATVQPGSGPGTEKTPSPQEDSEKAEVKSSSKSSSTASKKSSASADTTRPKRTTTRKKAEPKQE